MRVVPLKFPCCSQYQQAVQRSLQLQQQQALIQQQQQMLMQQQQQQPLYQPQVAQAQAQYAAMVSERVFSRPCGDASNSDGTSGRWRAPSKTTAVNSLKERRRNTWRLSVKQRRAESFHLMSGCPRVAPSVPNTGSEALRLSRKIAPPPRAKSGNWKQTLKTSYRVGPSLSEKRVFTPPPNQTHKHRSSKRRPARAAQFLVLFPDEGAPSVLFQRQSGPSGATRGRNRGWSPRSFPPRPRHMKEFTLQRAEATSQRKKKRKRKNFLFPGRALVVSNAERVSGTRLSAKWRRVVEYVAVTSDHLCLCGA